VLRQRLPVFAAALWWGSLSATGFIIVPLLFMHLPTPAIAGGMAAKLFTAQTWIAIASGLFLLLSARGKEAAARMEWAQGALVFIAGGLLLALLGKFAVAPRIVARENLRLWHSIGGGLYLLQWLCAGATLWKVTGLQGASNQA
jgi:hypothetical protein